MNHKLAKSASFIIILTCIAALSFSIRPAKASPATIYIRSDGSIDPPTAPIQRDGNLYTLLGNINESIIVQRNNIVIDGQSHRIQGIGAMFSKGIDLSGRKNVTVQNVEVEAFFYGIDLEYGATNNNISRNIITDNTWTGIFLSGSSNNTIIENNLAHNYVGINLDTSSNNRVIGNIFSGDGLAIYDSHKNTIEGNVINGKPLVYLESVSHQTVDNAGQVILNNCSDIRVENLNLSNTTVGLESWATNNSKIINNTMSNNAFGIWLHSDSSNNTISKNTITNTIYIGIYLIASSNNTITDNSITNSLDGVMLDSTSNYNSIARNDIKYSSEYGISLIGSSYNTIYHNNFIDNTQQAHITPASSPHFWDNGYPSGGNYWSDYNGTDTNRDGLGNSPYQLSTFNQDNHPLMGPFHTCSMGSWNGKQYNIDTISNSSITNFSFNPDNQTLSFTVEGTDDTAGFCRVTIPEGFMWCDIPDEWVVKVGITLIGDRNIIEQGDYTYIYFTYTHSLKTVEIKSTHAVPEFPFGIILPLLLITALLTALFCKGKDHTLTETTQETAIRPSQEKKLKM